MLGGFGKQLGRGNPLPAIQTDLASALENGHVCFTLNVQKGTDHNHWFEGTLQSEQAGFVIGLGIGIA